MRPGTEYTITIKRADKVIAERKVTVPAKSKGELIARFGIVADPHIGLFPDARYGRVFTKSVLMLENAFRDLQKSNADFIVSPGDISDSSRVQEITEVQKVVKKFPNMTFYCVPGNHDRLNSSKDFSPKIKSDTVSTVSPSISHEVMGPVAWNTKERQQVNETTRQQVIIEETHQCWCVSSCSLVVSWSRSLILSRFHRRRSSLVRQLRRASQDIGRFF